MPVTLPLPSTSTCQATCRYRISTFPVRSASCMVTLGSYLAPIGQIGMQLVLPAHTRRSWYGCELRPAGVLETFHVMLSRPMPGIFNCDVTASTAMSTFDSGIRGIGYFLLNVMPRYCWSSTLAET